MTCALSIGAQVWLTRLPAYKAIMEQYFHTADHRRSNSVSREVEALANTPLMDGQETKKDQLFRVAKANIVYNAAVAYVFIITLVSRKITPISPCR